jgi:hypothetical protein
MLATTPLHLTQYAGRSRSCNCRSRRRKNRRSKQDYRKIWSAATHSQKSEYVDLLCYMEKKIMGIDTDLREFFLKYISTDLREFFPGKEEAMRRIPMLDNLGRAYATGRRKTAVARVWVTKGSGNVTVNRSMMVFITILFHVN